MDDFIKKYYNITIRVDIRKKMNSQDINIESIAEKDTYSNEEKNFILERLNNDRLVDQLSSEKSTKKYSNKEKNDILDELNEERRKVQKREEMKKKRLNNKQIYKFGTKEYYKFVGMKREFYIETGFCEKFSGKPTIVTLYYLTFNELKKKDVLIRVEANSDKIYISYDAIRVYFKPYSLEIKREKF